MKYWGIVAKIVKRADIVLVISDARMPDLSRNMELERLVKLRKKKLFTVFNKIDLVNEKYLEYLKNKHFNAFFVSGVKNIGISDMKRALLIEAKREGIKEPLIGVVGYPNVGKSAVINALAHRAKAAISPVAGTTKGVQIIRAGGLHILDSPGVFPYGETELKLGLIAAKNPEQLKRPDALACEVIQTFLDNNLKALEDHYGIKVEDHRRVDSYDVMLLIGAARKFLLKGGVIDERRTALHIIRDWQSGRLKI